MSNIYIYIYILHNNIHIFILGVGSLKRWGLIQKFLFKERIRLCLKRRMEEKLLNQLLFSENGDGNKNGNEDIRETINELKKELQYLETFIKYYVVNVSSSREGNNNNNNNNNNELTPFK